MKTILLALTALFTLAAPASAFSQEAARQPWEEYDKLIKSSDTVGALGPTLFGDQVNFADGALSFSATDVSIRGNSSLPVAFTRTFTVSNRKGVINDGPMADWELDTPHLSGVFASSWPDNRCSVTTVSAARPPVVYAGSTPFLPEDYWHGNQASMPGGGEMLLVNASASKPTTGGPYYWMTSGQTYFSCLDTLEGGGTGQGFLAITADGTKYWFNRMASYSEPPLKGKTLGGLPTELSRRKVALYATRVEDRFGNWVTYTYTNAPSAPARLTSIDANDGRHITIGYNAQGKIASVSDGPRTWSYQYAYPYPYLGTLTAVILPDASRWSIDFAALSEATIRYEQGQPGAEDPVRSCSSPGEITNPESIQGVMTHPSGATGVFEVRPDRHGRSNVPMVCSNYTFTPANDSNDDVAYYPLNYDAFTLVSKRISGPGLATMEWDYTYGAAIYWAPGTGPVCFSGDCGAPRCLSDSCAGTAVTTINGPGNEWLRYTFGNSYRYNEGKLLKVERGTGPTDILKTETTTYELAQSGQPFLTPIGTSPQPRGNGFTAEYLRPQKAASILQGGETFSSTVDGFDEFARPLSVTKSSTLGFQRTEGTTYHDNRAKWVLGQVEKKTVNGAEVSRTEFDANERPWKIYDFTLQKQTLTYNTASGLTDPEAGTLKTVTDGNNNVTTLSSWKRGIPQLISHADGKSESAVVNNDGTIASVTDENGAGYTTSYAYDLMGRLKTITYPAGEGWSTTNLSFAPTTTTTAGYGVPVGLWKQTVSTGTGIKAVYFDAMWRPVVEESFDSINAGTTRSVAVKRYDTSGHLAFQSYPLNTLGSYTDATLKGSRTTYDALDRVTRVEQDNELGTAPLVTETKYLPDFKTEVTNPRLKKTTTSYMAYDQPSTDWPMAITHPEGAYTDITRDVYGKPLSVTRKNLAGTTKITRSYVYGGAQRLCIVTEPETGSTVSVFDNADNLDRSASGLVIPSGTSCSSAKALADASGRVVHRTYDARNRITSLSFPDGRGNTTHTYTDDGLPETITVDNGGGNVVATTYSYNKRRLPTREVLDWTSAGINWPIDYTYNANGHLASQVWHGITVDYAPNALGQATKAGTYASGVSYHPNGAIKQFTYGNGITHTLTQNLRGLPDTSCDSYGACGPSSVIFDGYDYDANGNVAAISDGLTINGVVGRGNRTMTYDGLDRLTRTQSRMFGTTTAGAAAYSYDVLDNLTRVTINTTDQLPARDHTYVYDPNNWRLTNVTNTVGGASVIGLDYDEQGNLKDKNGTKFGFDFGNRLRTTGTNADPDSIATYVYDGLGRRVRDFTTASKYSQYTQSGQLAMTGDARANTVSEYIYLGGSLVAIRERDTTTNVYTTKYQHTDALGSPVAVTDASRAVLERSEYEPFGKVLSATLKDGPGFTGHVLDKATGLNYMQQRYYDPQIGRFLSVDPVTADGSTGGNFNRYWYGNNNPYKFTDPDGRLAGDIGKETRETVQENQQVPENKPIVNAMASDVVTMVSNVDNWKNAASDIASDVGDMASNALETGVDLAQCAAGCAVKEFIGADTDDMVKNVGKDVALDVAGEAAADSVVGTTIVSGLKTLNTWGDAANTLVCSIECAHNSND
ncbi:MAG TPA: RHS repeat-associated core domain-containing protein [Lysobacter sp.]